MDEGGEPPDRGKTSNLVKTVEHHDSNGTLLQPEPHTRIKGYCNPSIVNTHIEGKGWPIFVREINDDRTIPRNESSRIKAGHMHSLTEIGELKTILGKNSPYANWGTEDLRAVMGPDGNIHMAAISFDGKNARIAYYISSPDLKDIQYIGTVSPKITLERAQKMLKKGSIYYNAISQSIESARRLGKKKTLIPCKDASPYFHGRGIKLFGRIEPCIQTHTLRLDDSDTNPNSLTTYEIIQAVREAGRVDFWENEILNLEERTIMTPETGQVKIGLGGPPIKIIGIEDGTEIGTIHSVFKSRRKFMGKEVNYYLYLGSLFSYDPKQDKVTAKIRDALIIPNLKEDRLREFDNQGNLITVKDIAFPSGLLQDPNNLETLFIYRGGGDKYSKWRSFGLEWYKEAASHPYNRQHIKDLLEAT